MISKAAVGRIIEQLKELYGAEVVKNKERAILPP